MTVKFLKINTFKKVCHFSCAQVVPYIEKEREKRKNITKGKKEDNTY